MESAWLCSQAEELTPVYLQHPVSLIESERGLLVKTTLRNQSLYYVSQSGEEIIQEIIQSDLTQIGVGVFCNPAITPC